MKILYAEDERALSCAVCEILKMEHYEVDAVYDGTQALEYLEEGVYDAAVLDVMMPGLNGIQVLERMRKRKDYTPVLLLTAKSAPENRIEGLETGADDYLSKPFDMGELVARIESMIRRTTTYRTQKLTCGNVALDCGTNELCAEGGSLRLCSKETELLELFMKYPGVSFGTDEIERRLWPEKAPEHAAILYISYLRNKLRQIHADIEIVKTPEGFALSDLQKDPLETVEERA